MPNLDSTKLKSCFNPELVVSQQTLISVGLTLPSPSKYPLNKAANFSLFRFRNKPGILLFFALEKFLHWHHHGEDTENHIHPVGKLVLFSDAVHNFLDGMIIGASFLVSVPVGLATTIAVVLHEIPQEIGDFAVLLHSGYTKARALWLNFLSALAALLGALVLFSLGEIAEISATWLVPIAAGGFIYIAVADLMPELHKTKELKYSILQIGAVMIGVLAMVALTLLE